MQAIDTGTTFIYVPDKVASSFYGLVSHPYVQKPMEQGNKYSQIPGAQPAIQYGPGTFLRS